MLTASARAYFDNRPPVAGDVAAYDITTSTAAVAIPTAWRSKFVTFYADGGDVFILFGAATVIADPAATGATTPTKQCVKIASGTAEDWYIPPVSDGAVLYFCARTASGTATLRTFPSSRQEGQKEPSQP